MHRVSGIIFIFEIARSKLLYKGKKSQNYEYIKELNFHMNFILKLTRFLETRYSRFFNPWKYLIVFLFLKKSLKRYQFIFWINLLYINIPEECGLKKHTDCCNSKNQKQRNTPVSSLITLLYITIMTLRQPVNLGTPING